MNLNLCFKYHAASFSTAGCRLYSAGVRKSVFILPTFFIIKNVGKIKKDVFTCMLYVGLAASTGSITGEMTDV
jgi:hypothetical protein